MMPLTGWEQYGLVGLIFASVIGLLFLVIKWTLCTTRDILIQAAAERISWQETMKTFNVSIVEHNERARNFHESVCEAHKFQREEHGKMIDNLNNLSVQNKEITASLGRINGYKS
jgi:predicted acetyltransferase